MDSSEKAENDKRATTVIYDKLLAETQIKIQEPMIQRELKAMKEELKQRAELQGQNLDELMAKEDSEKIDAEMREEAEKRIKTALIISRIAKNEKISISGADFEAKIMEISRLYATPREVILQEIQKNPNLLYSLNQQIMSRKVTDFLLENAKINEK